MKIQVITTTCSNDPEALTIANKVVEEKLAFCAQVTPQITSIYPWKEKIEQSSEVGLVLKTSSNLSDRLVSRLRELHPYQTPQVISYPAEIISVPYENWAKDWLNSTES